MQSRLGQCGEGGCVACAGRGLEQGQRPGAYPPYLDCAKSLRSSYTELYPQSVDAMDQVLTCGVDGRQPPSKRDQLPFFNYLELAGIRSLDFY